MESITQEIQFTHRYWVLLLPLILMSADIVTGWIQATINGTWDSTKMRTGLFRKSGEMLVIAYADDSIARRDTLSFTILQDTLARDAMRWNADGRRLIIGYERYSGRLPWRGSSVVVTDIAMDSDRIERLGPVPASEP